MAGQPSDAELHEALERAFAEAGLGAPSLIRRRPSEYRTSFPLEELELTLEDGAKLRLAFKRLEWDALTTEARLAKPRFLHDPRREPAVYAELLAPTAFAGAPRYYGAAIKPEAERYWLFVEWVEGRELYQVGERELWEAAATWLGAMHRRLGAELDRHAASGRLLDHDRAHYRRWIERALAFAAAQPPSRLDSIEWLAPRYELASEELLALPRTVIHGEFYASNVLVAGDPADPRVAPVDWELAGLAPGVVDLAALVSGGWSDEDRDAIAAAYRTAAGTFSPSPRELDLARLCLAVQWLGWAEPSWVPPPGQQQDWLGEALSLAKELEL